MVPDVEGKPEALFGDDDGRVGAKRMAHPQLVDGVGIRGRQIRDHHVSVEQRLVHGLVDCTGGQHVVGPDSLEPDHFQTFEQVQAIAVGAVP